MIFCMYIIDYIIIKVNRFRFGRYDRKRFSKYQSWCLSFYVKNIVNFSKAYLEDVSSTTFHYSMSIVQFFVCTQSPGIQMTKGMAAMLVYTTKEYNYNHIVIVHQHVGYDVTCKPRILTDV